MIYYNKELMQQWMRMSKETKKRRKYDQRKLDSPLKLKITIEFFANLSIHNACSLAICGFASDFLQPVSYPLDGFVMNLVLWLTIPVIWAHTETFIPLKYCAWNIKKLSTDVQVDNSKKQQIIVLCFYKMG